MRVGRRRVYSGVLDIPEGQSGGVRITHRHQPAGWETTSGTLRTSMFGQKSEALRFKEPTRWHELSEDGQGVWMTDVPVEQRQMDELILKARGRVLVGGLGLGYAVVALSKRPAVKEIVVVEQNEHVIKLVWKATLAKVDKPTRCSVVHADLFHYLTTLKKNAFTWGLFDIWQADGETCFHEVVVPLRRLAHGKVKTVVCWNEDIMRGQLWNALRTRLHLLSLKPSAAISDAVGLNLDRLCEDHDSPYLKWAVPFWRWYRDQKDNVSSDYLEFVMMQYVAGYGRPESNDGLGWLHDVRRTGAHA